MMDDEFAHADSTAYRLAALLRITERSARELGEARQDFDHRLACNDIAEILDVAGELICTVHDALQTLRHEVKE